MTLILPEFEHPFGTLDSDQIPHIIKAVIAAMQQSLPYIYRLLQTPAAPG